MECRAGCGACCIAPSINQPFYGMPNGKKAGERCTHLDKNHFCRLFGDIKRPSCCHSFAAEESVCKNSFEEAVQVLNFLEQQTLPS